MCQKRHTQSVKLDIQNLSQTEWRAWNITASNLRLDNLYEKQTQIQISHNSNTWHTQNPKTPWCTKNFQKNRRNHKTLDTKNTFCRLAKVTRVARDSMALKCSVAARPWRTAATRVFKMLENRVQHVKLPAQQIFSVSIFSPTFLHLLTKWFLSFGGRLSLVAA